MDVVWWYPGKDILGDDGSTANGVAGYLRFNAEISKANPKVQFDTEYQLLSKRYN